MLPTLMAAAGDADVKEKLLKGMKVGDKTFKVHLDGYNITDALAGKSPSPRHEFFYWSDDGSLVALRYDNWKIVFQEQRAHGFDVWQEPFVTLRLPKIFNLRSDPFEMADHVGIGYAKWRIDRTFLLVPAQQFVGAVHRHVQGIPAEPESRQLLARSSAGEALDERRQVIAAEWLNRHTPTTRSRRRRPVTRPLPFAFEEKPNGRQESAAENPRSSRHRGASRTPWGPHSPGGRLDSWRGMVVRGPKRGADDGDVIVSRPRSSPPSRTRLRHQVSGLRAWCGFLAASSRWAPPSSRG